MALLYGLVARDSDCILVDVVNPTIGVGNYQLLTRNLLKKLKRNVTLSLRYDDKFISFVLKQLQSSYQFHYINETIFNGNLTFLCLVESSFPKRLSFGYLRDIREYYLEKLSTQSQQIQFQFQSSPFQSYLLERMQFYNDPSKDKLRQLQNNVKDVKEIMIENIDKILERGEKIDILVEKTETMAVQSTLLKKQARQVRKIMWWRNWKINVLIGIVVCIVIWLILSFCCGFDFHRCK